MIIKLNSIYYDPRARDGTWCTLPYPNHPRGCPNFPKCPANRTDFKDLQGIEWWAVVEEFDLAAHAKKMKAKHKGWSDLQARCILYWQKGVRSRLFKKSEAYMKEISGTIILAIPEANGINMFKTMAAHGLFLKANPDYVYKIMLVGKQMPTLDCDKDHI